MRTQLLLTSLIITFITSCAEEEPVDLERRAMIDFYQSLNGSSWRSNYLWNTDTPVGDWWAVIENKSTGKVEHILLGENEMSGSISSSIYNLTELEELDLIRNNISSLGTGIYDCPKLKILRMYENNLSNLPSDIGKLTSLEELDLQNNKISGSLTSEIGKLTNLRRLSLSNNNFSGSIPVEIAQLKNLTYLSLRNNNFEGEIPQEILDMNLPLLSYDIENRIGYDPEDYD